MNNTILNAANLYAKGLEEVQRKRKDWLSKYKEVRDILKETAVYLNENADYKPGYFVDTNHAFNEEINGTCADIPSITFRCGEMPLHISFRNASGERREYAEEGFLLLFTPTITGQVVVMLRPHHSSLAPETPQFVNLAIIDEPGKLTVEDVNTLVTKGLETAFSTSYTGMGSLHRKDAEAPGKPKEYVPIGFKRFESTQHVQ
ncbi:MAG: hypothetical protein EBZ77_13820 [Chitinophagia bacterium]|nr:hypothetical protein [Chitinophagia bacterium]